MGGFTEEKEKQNSKTIALNCYKQPWQLSITDFEKLGI